MRDRGRIWNIPLTSAEALQCQENYDMWGEYLTLRTVLVSTYKTWELIWKMEGGHGICQSSLQSLCTKGIFLVPPCIIIGFYFYFKMWHWMYCNLGHKSQKAIPYSSGFADELGKTPGTHDCPCSIISGTLKRTSQGRTKEEYFIRWCIFRQPTDLAC